MIKDFSKVYVSGAGIPEYINKLGEGTIGLELGVWTGENFAYILQQCPGIKTLYGIDQYKPYQDWNRPITQEMIDDVKRQALENIEASGHKDKVILHEVSAVEGLSLIPDGSLDWIFVDGDHSYEGTLSDCEKYYPFLKKGGFFCGHDYSSIEAVHQAVSDFRAKNNITAPINLSKNSTFFWYK